MGSADVQRVASLQDQPATLFEESPYPVFSKYMQEGSIEKRCQKRSLIISCSETPNSVLLLGIRTLKCVPGALKYYLPLSETEREDIDSITHHRESMASRNNAILMLLGYMLYQCTLVQHSLFIHLLIKQVYEAPATDQTHSRDNGPRHAENWRPKKEDFIYLGRTQCSMVKCK